MKRIFDVVVSSLLLLLFSPVLLLFSILVYLQDFHNPFYSAARVGLNEKKFTMLKLRSMIVNADKSGVDSTASDDKRITKIGALVRKCKLDELTQLVNVVKGDMSLVGPRPNVKRETDLYTAEEKRLLSVRPGITDLASIVFSDEGDILKGSQNPDIDYNQLIRPGKGYLGLCYIDNQSIVLDIKIIVLTAMAIVKKSLALRGVIAILKKLNADDHIIEIGKRDKALVPMPPPGSSTIVTTRDGSL